MWSIDTDNFSNFMEMFYSNLINYTMRIYHSVHYLQLEFHL